MSVTVHFPASLQPLTGHTLVVADPVSTVAQLVTALDRLAPGLADRLDDPLYNIAVNDELLLHNVDRHPVSDGDVIEVVPTIAGG
jgi:molybdopterin converting factor small subunit